MRGSRSADALGSGSQAHNLRGADIPSIPTPSCSPCEPARPRAARAPRLRMGEPAATPAHRMTRIEIRLTSRQVRQVVHDASPADEVGGEASLILRLPSAAALDGLLAEMGASARYSSSLVRALRVLAAVPDKDTSLKVIVDAARLSPSSTHRYLCTWAALGVVEQDEESRLYRRGSDAPNGDPSDG